MRTLPISLHSRCVRGREAITRRLLSPRLRVRTIHLLAPRHVLVLPVRVRYPLIFDDLTFPNDVIRREHSPPGLVSVARAERTVA